MLSKIAHFRRYSDHWQLLVTACHILLKKKQSIEEIVRANDVIKNFVAITEKLYSKSAMTYNVHILSHLCQSVIDWGPLFAHNCYTFVSGNGNIVKMIKSSQGVLHQINRLIMYKKSAYILENHVKINFEDSPVLDFLEQLTERVTNKYCKIGNRLYTGKSTLKLPADFNLNFLVCPKAYTRLIRDSILFTSCTS